jgi:hypothetical protein
MWPKRRLLYDKQDRQCYGIHILALTVKIEENTNKCTVLYYKIFTIVARTRLTVTFSYIACLNLQVKHPCCASVKYIYIYILNHRHAQHNLKYLQNLQYLPVKMFLCMTVVYNIYNCLYC